MVNRLYAQINCSLTSSKKIRALKIEKAPWAYISVHLADPSNYLEIFTYPRVLWAYDSLVPIDELDDVIADIEKVGLVEYDHEQEVVRIIGWFHKKNAPENGSRAIGLITDFQSTELLSGPMRLRSIAEFAFGTLKLAQN